MPDDQIPHDQQITPAHVLEVLNQQVIPRLDKLEETVRDSGLNGHTPYLKAFLEQYAGTYATRQAWITVKSDLKHRFRFLTQPRAWFRTIFYASLGAIGWELISTSVAHPPHLP